MIVRLPRIAVPLLAFALGGCSGGEAAHRPAQAAQAIIGGVDDNTHTNVVGIAILRSGGLATCTGSLITPTLVLTARHCVSPTGESGVVCTDATINGMTYRTSLTEEPYPSVSFYVTTSGNLSRAASITRVSEVLTPPDSTGVALCGRDIALLRLASPITSVAPIRPRLDMPPGVDEVFTASGYGATTGAGGGSGRRRMRDGLVVRFVGQIINRGITLLEDSEWLADTGTCRGDSGGPALDDLGEVFGVLSRGQSNACESPVYTRVDSYAGWIREEAARASAEGGYPEPSWVAAPEARAGLQGEACASDDQCDPSLYCRATGWARECSTADCDACPEGWLCREGGGLCVRDPSTRPAEPEDAGVAKPEDAGEAVADDAGEATADAAEAGVTPPATTAAANSSCDAGRVGGRAGGGRGVGAGVLAALGWVATRRRRAGSR